LLFAVAIRQASGNKGAFGSSPAGNSARQARKTEPDLRDVFGITRFLAEKTRQARHSTIERNCRHPFI
jgi:hypothetical protein